MDVYQGCLILCVGTFCLAMARGKLIVICQSGGKFSTNNDGSLSYTGGDAHAMSVNTETRFDEFKLEIAEMWKYDSNSMTIKYFLPNNKRTLITISSDKDIQRMIDFHEDSATVDVYVMTGEIATYDVSSMPCSRYYALFDLYMLSRKRNNQPANWWVICCSFKVCIWFVVGVMTGLLWFPL